MGHTTRAGGNVAHDLSAPLRDAAGEKKTVLYIGKDFSLDGRMSLTKRREVDHVAGQRDMAHLPTRFLTDHSLDSIE